jgi:hypothetical protein
VADPGGSARALTSTLLGMLDRSRACRALSAAFAVACLLLPTATAQGATSPPQVEKRPVPADAPVVATTASGTAVIAWVLGGRTCTVLQEKGAPRPTTLDDGDIDFGPSSDERPDGACVTTPVLSQFRAQSVWSRPTALPMEPRIVWGVAGPGSARVELRRGGAVRASSPATPAPLPGPAAALRFWAIEEVSGTEDPDEVAVLDAAGTVRRAFAPEEISSGWGPNAAEQVNAPALAGALLRRGRSGPVSWQLRQTTKQKLVPTPLAPERRVTVRCLALAVKVAGGLADTGRRYDLSQGGPCDDDDEIALTPLALQQNSSCNVGTTLTALARPPVRSVVAVLADGRRAPIALSALRGATGLRGGALVVPPTLGVRRLEGLGADGHVASTRSVGTAPLQHDCSGSTSFWTESLLGSTDDKLGAAPHTLQAVDSGVELCLAVNRAPLVPPDCLMPPLDPETSWIGALDAPGGQYLYGLVTPEVAAARVTFTDGSTQTVPATPIPNYAGQYASTIAQIALDVPGPRVARSAALLDAGGRVLGRTRTLGPLSFEIGHATTLRPAADGLAALRATPATLTFGRDTAHMTCIGFTVPRTIYDACDLSLDASMSVAETVTVSARCAPRRLVVLAALRRSTDRLAVRTRGGGEVVAQSIRLPAAAGGAAARYVALAVLRPHQAIASVRLRGKAARELPLSYPAAADQCGYSDQPGYAFS